jgi:A/G-specific adenine glycosylase
LFCYQENRVFLCFAGISGFHLTKKLLFRKKKWYEKRMEQFDFSAFSLWYQKQKRDLPWRKNHTRKIDLYPVWISEIMLQQTQVITVMGYFHRFMKAFPTVESLARADFDYVASLFAGLGYYSRVVNLHKAAKVLSEKGFPQTYQDWLLIPGIGPYTASALCGIGLNQVVGLVDANVLRFLSRFSGCFLTQKSQSDFIQNLSRDLCQKAKDQGNPPRFFCQGLMEIGALICTARQPQCNLCPVQSGCYAFLNQKVSELPVKKKKPPLEYVMEERVCLFNEKEEIALCKAAQGQWRAGLWDLPLWEVGFSKKTKVITQHVVTNHRIQRQTYCVFLKEELKRKDLKWVKISPQFFLKPALGLGSAAKKTLQAISQQLDKNWF